MKKQKYILEGMAGGHRSKKDYRLLVLQAGKVVYEERSITTFQAKALAYWWNSTTAYGVQICKNKMKRFRRK